MDGAGSETDRRHMQRALQLAEAGWGRVHPNPLVGAVVVRDGEVVGEGAHREYGGPHAEVEALEAAGERARGATLYVTLEPCAHHGQTPPCTTAIRSSGVGRVVYAASDPHPEAAGGGEALVAAGIDVEGGVLREEARVQNALFLTPIEQARPFVALKFGLTLDARIARREGERTLVTGPEAQEEAHRLRCGYDAILVGGRTARVDDPSLTVRFGREPRVPPARVVADPAARLPLDSALIRSAGESRVRLLVAPSADRGRVRSLEAAGVDVVEVPAAGGGLDLGRALDRLMEDGVRTVLCEGGGRLAAALLDVDRVDRLYLFYAPMLYGGGVPAFPAGRFHGRRVDTRRVGVDTLITIDRSE